MKKIAYIFLLLSLVSCKDFLDIKPKGKTIPKTAQEFSELLQTTLYDIDEGEAYVVGSIGSVFNYELYAENLEASLTTFSQTGTLPYYVGDDINGSIDDIYRNTYETIRDCNIVLGYMEDRSSRLALDVLATAHLLRGICYYNLLRTHCEAPDPAQLTTQLGLPLVLEFDMEARPTRSSMALTIRAIEDDFKKAMQYGISDQEVFLFSVDIAKAYLARLYYWVGDYEAAIPLAEEILQKYPLLDRGAYQTMMQQEFDQTGNMLLRGGRRGTSATVTRTRKNLARRPVSKRFIDLFPEKERDVRYGMWFNSRRETTKIFFAGLRSAEMCLMLAECHYLLDHQSSEALDYLNQLRSKRISDYTPYTMDNLPEIDSRDPIKQDAQGEPLTRLGYAIIAERSKELFLEGDRWFQLKHNGGPEFWSTRSNLKFVTEHFLYTFPFPIQDIMLTEGLGQNEGYDKTR